MDRGIVGFRFDAVKHLYESDSFLDEPCIGTEEACATQYASLNHIYTVDLPETIEIIKEWREFTNNHTRNKNITLSW